MDRETLDLSLLDPSTDPAHWERLVGAITANAAPELARRAAVAGGIVLLAHWARPIVAIAAALAIAAVSTLALAARGPAIVSTGMAEMMGLPMPVSDWLVEERLPVAADLMFALEGEMP